MIELKPVPLHAQNFARFGDVIELEQAEQQSINQGLTTRFHDLFAIDAGDQGGRAIVSVFRTRPLPLPHRARVMECHLPHHQHCATHRKQMNTNHAIAALPIVTLAAPAQLPGGIQTARADRLKVAQILRLHGSAGANAMPRIAPATETDTP